jgi:hypothetical protein
VANRRQAAQEAGDLHLQSGGKRRGVHEANVYHRMADSGAAWAADLAVERAAASFLQRPVGMHPAIKLGLGAILAAIAIPFAIGAAIAIAQAALTIAGIVFGAIFVASLITGGS